MGSPCGTRVGVAMPIPSEGAAEAPEVLPRVSRGEEGDTLDRTRPPDPEADPPKLPNVAATESSSFGGQLPDGEHIK